MASPRYLLALAATRNDDRPHFEALAAETGFELAAFDSANAALGWLTTHAPGCVLFGAGLPRVDRVCERIRMHREWLDVPLIAMASQFVDDAVAKLYARGADDVVPWGAWTGIAARLQYMPRTSAPIVDAERPLAIIADPDRARCDLVARVLAGAGYEIKTALDARSLGFYLRQFHPHVVVANAELADPKSAFDAEPELGQRTTWAVTAPASDVERLRDAFAAHDRLVVVEQTAAPADVLFLSNEIAHKSAQSRREASRRLYGAVVRFRPVGSEDDDTGFTYNVSEDGLYIRTLAPTIAPVVWVDVRPPASRTTVRLEGRVTWHRAPGSPTVIPAPYGFAVELNAGLGRSHELWRKGCRELGARRPERGSAAGPREAPSIPRPQPRPSTARVDYFTDPLPASLRMSEVEAVLDQLETKVSSADEPDSPGGDTGREPASRDLGTAESDSLPPDGGSEVERLDSLEPEALLSAPPSEAPAPLEEPASRETPGPPLEPVQLVEPARLEPAPHEEPGALPLPRAEPPTLPREEPEALPSGKPAAVPLPRTQPNVLPGLVEPQPLPTEGPSAPTRQDARAAAEPPPLRKARTRGAKGGQSSAATWAILAATAAAIVAILVYRAGQANEQQAPPERRPSAPTAARAADEPEVSDEAPPPENALPPAANAETEAAEAAGQASAEAGSAPSASKPAPTASTQSAALEPSNGQPAASAVAAPEAAAADAATLPPFEGMLRVASSRNLAVYVQGIEVGPTNEWLKARCGMKFVRLANEPGKWAGPGRPVKIRCQDVTDLRIEPSP